MKVDQDNKERIMIIFKFMLQFYKVLMGNLLVMFVPQDCGGTICSLNENLTKEGAFHRVVLGINFTSLLFFTITYLVELNRENVFIKHLDIDQDESDNNLQQIMRSNDKLKTLIHKQNHLYLFSISLTGMVYIVNLCFSVIDIFLNQTGSGSLTSLLSFVILVLMKLNNSYTVGRKSNLEDLALSGYLIESASFNVLDKDEYPEIEELDSSEDLDCNEEVVSLDLNDVDVKIKGI